MKHANLIDILTKNLHSEDAARTYCIIINALTGATCSNVMRSIYEERKGYTDAPDLDTRNAQDELTRGTEVGDELTAMSGFNVALKPMESARILDAIRFTMYSEMHAWGEFADESALIFTPTQSITARPNYDQPMSAQMYMEFRIKMADQINPKEVELATKRLSITIPGITETIVRDALQIEANKSKARLTELKPHVLSEIGSFECIHGIEAFTSLDVIEQCAIATKIATKFDALFTRLLPSAVRTLEGASKLESVQRQHTLVKQWLLANDDELQAAMLLRKAA